MTTDTPHPLTGWACAAGVVLIWSGWVVISRLGVFQTLNSYDIMALRFGVASVAVAPFVWRFWPRQLKWWQLAFIACGQGIPYLLFAFGGFQFAPAAHAGIIMNGFLPVLAAMIGWVWLKEAPGSWRAVGIAIIVAGCVLTSWDTASAGVGPDAWKGHLLFVAAACMVAAYMVATKAWELRPRQAMVCIPVINLAAFLPAYVLFLPKGIYRADWSEIALQGLYQGLGPSVLAVLLFTTAVRTIGPSPTAAMMALVPGMASLLAIPVLGETPSLLAVTGLVIVSAGIALAAGMRPRAKASGVIQKS
jgi:drug/metabolite transporter (DMT)-like permease